MILLILDWLAARGDSPDLGVWRLLTYISVRSALVLVITFVTMLVIGPRMIGILRALKAGQVIRKAIRRDTIDLHAMHGQKAGTPTMGGLLMIAAMLPTVLLFCRLDNPYFLLLLAMTLGYGLLGFWDDYLKIVRKNHLGVSPRGKLLVQAALGVALGAVLLLAEWPVNYEPTAATGYGYLLVPFFKWLYPDLGLWFIVLVVVVMLATSNAVNLTDGLDGLAIGVSIANIAAFIIIAYIASRVDFSRFLFIPYIPGGGEMVVFLAALMGASLGFLWFNAHPAEIFMGDTGSMMLGGAIGATAILLKQELLLIVIGGVFVVEAVSVILQIGFFRMTGTRLFRMSPLHHHFEKRGMVESKIINRFWIVSWLLAVAGLGMLKLR